MTEPDPGNDVIRVMLRRCGIHPAELPMPYAREQDAPQAGPNLDQQFQNPCPTSGQRALANFWRI